MEEASGPGASAGSAENAVAAAVMRWLVENRVDGAEPPTISVLGRDPLHDLVTVVWRAALERSLDRGSMEALLWTAVRHGEIRRGQGYTEEALLEEYRLLQHLLGAHPSARLRALGSPVGAGERLQAAMTLCVGGALRGFHRDALDAAGDWPHVVQRFLLAFHPPGARGAASPPGG